MVLIRPGTISVPRVLPPVVNVVAGLTELTDTVSVVRLIPIRIRRFVLPPNSRVLDARPESPISSGAQNEVMIVP